VLASTEAGTTGETHALALNATPTPSIINKTPRRRLPDARGRGLSEKIFIVASSPWGGTTYGRHGSKTLHRQQDAYLGVIPPSSLSRDFAPK
jgi:hypothetical protein